MVHACNANTQEVGAGGSQIHLQLHSELQVSQGHIRTCRKEKEEKRESSTDRWTIWCSRQVVSGSIQLHSLYKEKECPGVNVPNFQQTPLFFHAPPHHVYSTCLFKPLWEPEGKDNTGYVQGACCHLCRLTQPHGSSVVSTPWFLSCSRGDSAIPDLSLSIQLKTGYFDILL